VLDPCTLHVFASRPPWMSFEKLRHSNSSACSLRLLAPLVRQSFQADPPAQVDRGHAVSRIDFDRLHPRKRDELRARARALSPSFPLSLLYDYPFALPSFQYRVEELFRS